jgi:diguanylate cyclase (GGDEF)-like protein/PAS domain S-box-containing protein
VGQLIYDLGNKQWDIPKLRELLETILSEKTTFDNYEVEHDFADIGRRIMLLNARQIQRVSGKERIILLAIEDITERKRAEEALRASEENFHRSLDESPQGVRIISKEGETLYANRVILDIFGYDSIEELQTIPTVKRYTEQSYAAFKVRREERRLGKDNSPKYGIDIVRKDGEVRHLQVWRKRILWNGKEHYQVIYSDITDRKQAEKALEESEKRYRELSIVDDLTQLDNSRHFYFQLKIELDRSNRYDQPLTLLLLDLDDFKQFNDAYGHVEGDQVLWRFGQVAKRCLRETDFAYRYGGEEFTILLPMTTSTDGAVTAERIRTEFKKETFFPAPGQDVHVTVSIGLAQYKPKEEMKAFVHRVDQLMYQGKKNGKDRVCSEL